MSTTFTLIWEEKGVNETGETFNFRQRFPNESKPLFFGTIEPNLEKSNVRVYKVHFTDVHFANGCLELYTPRYSKMRLHIGKTIEFRIKTPEVCVMPQVLNKILLSKIDMCYAHVFYEDTIVSGTSPQYLNSIKGRWGDFFLLIRNLLIRSNLGRFGIKCRIIGSQAFSDSEQTFINAFDAFDKRSHLLEFGKQTVCIVVSSEDSIKFECGGRTLKVDNIHHIPKDLIYRAADLMALYDQRNVKAICRRIIVACYNRGIPLNLFDLMREFGVTEDHFPYLSSDFDRSQIGFSHLSESELETFKLQVQLPAYNMTNFIKLNASEYELRSLFWDIVFNQNLMNAAIELNTSVEHFRPSSEWNTQNLFPRLDDRIVDFVVLDRRWNEEIPIVLIEVGKEPFGVGADSHKDFSKLLGLISACCRKLVRKLEANNQSGHDARVYGVWVGGSQFQACVAHPKFHLNDDDCFDIVVHLHFPPEWKFDVLGNQVFTNPETPFRYDRILQGTLTEVPPYNPDPEVLTNNETLINIDPVSEHVAVEEEPVLAMEIDANLFNGTFNYHALSKLKSVFKAALNRFNVSTFLGGIRILVPEDREGDDGIFVSSRDSSTQQTPASDQIRESPELHTEPMSPSVRRAASNRGRSRNRNLEFLRRKLYRKGGIEIKKKSLFEFKLYKDCFSALPTYFVKVYYLARDKKDTNVFYFGFQELDVFMDKYGKLARCFTIYNYESSLRTMVVFALEILNCIQILHDWFGIVHSDLSPRNIGYSHSPYVWKVFDFDQSMNVEESARTVRVAGTPGYIAPESLQTGIFTKESDIWSFGRIMFNHLLLPIMNHVSASNDPDLTPRLRTLYHDFEDVAISMMATNPRLRPTAVQALKRLLPILDRIEKDRTPESIVYKRVYDLCREVDEISCQSI